ncbi:molybdate ABC transporter substrate-binding protein [Polymorphobacter glacialis]|uniref:Molybdate ABC transporter substrate-binding protein n=1 Tax=Sandarakinorhabdus glacialis TaxID=1614636 RepID=A0A916ZRP9_9SPHN|nr:molybdate ABC transporter substrate-binding protein [Polymorphobacter glacialis]GGE11074.1 molybdate ABC transporter substrate-binding protein [Polymorphobacter glacialis]
MPVYSGSKGDDAMLKIIARLMLALALLTGSLVHAQTAPNIAVASDLRLAFSDVAAAFTRDTGLAVRPTFGSSGNFFRQLQQGAPFELFLSADESYVLDLAKTGKTDGDGTLYAIGRLAIVAPHGSPLRLDGKLAGLRAAIRAGQIRRFAIANPEHAPYGQRAEEVLRGAGLWQPLAGRLVLGENVSQALQFATSGGAQGGIIAYSLVLDPAFAHRANYALIPASAHAPLRQRMVLMQGAGATAQRFYAYLQAPPARRILARHGFALPSPALLKAKT